MVALAAGVALLRQVRAARRFSSSALREVWVRGTETMLDVPGAGTVSLAVAATPEESAASFFPGGPPRALAAAFALTAFDPPGASRTRRANEMANGVLWRAHLSALPFTACWRGFGVDVGEGWREDGFVLAFPDAAAARAAVVRAAAAADQGAIYEYAVRGGALYRRTLGVGLDMDEETPMRAVDHGALSASAPDLVDLPWAGPRAFPPA